MIDIVIPLGTGSKWQDNEVRYALRSIEKYLRGYGRVFIVGNKRKWMKESECIETQCGAAYTKGIHYIEAGENYTEKQKSIFNKLVLAARHERVSETFIKWHDDHFLLKPLHVDDLKNWTSGTLDRLGIIATGTYQRTVLNTNRYLSKRGWDNKHFDIHVPIKMEKEKVLGLLDEDWSRDYIIKSLYGNKYAIPSEEMRDLKFARSFRREEILNAIDGRMFFSISDNAINEAMKTVLSELYPEPSKWEI